MSAVVVFGEGAGVRKGGGLNVPNSRSLTDSALAHKQAKRLSNKVAGSIFGVGGRRRAAAGS